MNARTRLSAKGQVVIPKDVRDRLGLVPGQALDVTIAGGGVVLRPSRIKTGESFETIEARMRARNSYRGPSATIEDMDRAIAEMWTKGGRHWA